MKNYNLGYILATIIIIVFSSCKLSNKEQERTVNQTCMDKKEGALRHSFVQYLPGANYYKDTIFQRISVGRIPGKVPAGAAQYLTHYVLAYRTSEHLVTFTNSMQFLDSARYDKVVINTLRWNSSMNTGYTYVTHSWDDAWLTSTLMSSFYDAVHYIQEPPLTRETGLYVFTGNYPVLIDYTNE